MTLVLDTQVIDTEWAQIVDRISRRRFFGGAAGVAAALALSACGSSDGESDSASDTLPYTWAEFSGDVPRDPKRVVVLDGRVDLEFAMMMDYPIVGSGNFWFPDAKAGFQFPGRTIEGASFVNVAGDFSTNFEALLALEPDLIVITAIGYTSDWYGTERLSSIAPLLVVGDDVEPIAGHPVDWRGALMAQASQLDRVAIAEASIAEYDDKLARLRPMLQEKLGGKKIVFGVQTPTGFLVHQRNLRISVAIDAGLDVLFRDDDNAENSFELSFEQLDTLAPADVIIAQARDQEALDAIKTQPTWQRLPAVQAGNVLTSDARYNQGFALTAAIFLDVLEEAAGRITAGE